jgi:dihydropteroate synthase
MSAPAGSPSPPPDRRERIHFVTGRLAEPSLRASLESVAARVGFDYTVDVLNITVAALMTTSWIARRIRVPEGTNRVIVPGLVRGDLAEIEAVTGAAVERGPEDLRRLAEHFGRESDARAGYGAHSIEILAEINHAPRLPLVDLLATAARLAADGADIIDVGCSPGSIWSGVGEAVRALVAEGHRVSIDSFEPREIAAAARAGCGLVLSVNSTNVAAAADWGCEVVAVPDQPGAAEDGSFGGLDDTVERLSAEGVPFRVDPVLEPIGFGFAASLGRYLAARRRYPAAAMLMGIGNLTELTDVDSAGINTLLLGFCQEVGIGSILTTQVIHWAAGSVKECDLARRLVHHAVTRRMLPKHLEPGLVTLRAGRPEVHGDVVLDRLAAAIRDTSIRLFAERGEIHLVAKGLHCWSRDPFALFRRLVDSGRDDIDPAHAFYLGYEAAKAATALTLGKDYRQDQPLDWGYCTEPEAGHGPSQAAAEAARAAGDGTRVPP